MRHRPRPLAAVFLISAAAVLSLAACDDDESTDAGTLSNRKGTVPPEQADSSVTVRAVDIQWTDKELSAGAGVVAITLVNDGTVRHSLLVEGRETEFMLEVARNGDAETGTITLEKGKHVFYCDLPGHRPAGMEGTLTVS